MPRALNAAVNSFKAINTATVTNAAKAIGAYDMVEKTIARSNRPTKMEGKSFRPAFLFIASLIE